MTSQLFRLDISGLGHDYPFIPRVPCLGSFEMFSGIRTIYFNRKYITRGILGCPPGFWPLDINTAEATIIIHNCDHL